MPGLQNFNPIYKIKIMKKLNLLSKAEMKKVLGGVVPTVDQCATPECNSNSDCTNSSYGPICKTVQCPNSDQRTSYCANA